MKAIIRFVVWAAILAGAANYLVYLQTGTMPIKTWLAKFQQNPISKVVAENVDGASKISAAKKVTIYKWTDANGVVHYDNQPVKGASVVEVSTNTNSMPAPEKTESSTADSKPQTADEQARRLQEAKQAFIDAQTQ